MSFTRLIILFAAASTLSGCATMFNGTRQEVSFETRPKGAIVRANGEELCKTPCKAELTRSDEHLITMELPGHYPYRMTMRKRGSNWMAIYALFPNPLFIAIDLISGSAWFLTPEDGINRELDKVVEEDAVELPKTPVASGS